MRIRPRPRNDGLGGQDLNYRVLPPFHLPFPNHSESESWPKTNLLLQTADLFPLLPLRDVVVFPHMVIPLFVGRAKSIKALEAAMEAGKSIVLVAQKSAAKDEPATEDIYRIGSIANILQMLKLPDGTVKVLVEGTQRAKVLRIFDDKSHLDAEIQPVPD